MEQFATEEQQVEAIKRFWSEHGTSLIVGAVLGLAGLFGWQYYSDSQIAAKESASQAFSFAKSSNKELADFAGRSNREAFDLSREAIGTYEDLVDKTGEKVTEAQVTSANATGRTHTHTPCP